MELAVDIVRFVSDEPQPGVVACEVWDAKGRKHAFIDKVPGFTAEVLDASSGYPQRGGIRCKKMATWRDENGRDVVRISTEFPDHIESSEGVLEFDVFANQLSPVGESGQ
jgi:hypothetical protein